MLICSDSNPVIFCSVVVLVFNCSRTPKEEQNYKTDAVLLREFMIKCSYFKKILALGLVVIILESVKCTVFIVASYALTLFSFTSYLEVIIV